MVRTQRILNSVYAATFCVLTLAVAGCFQSTDGPATQGADAEVPAASLPLGTELVYASFRHGTTELQIRTESGSLPIETGEAADSESHPAFSADGERLVFIADRLGVPKLRVMTLSSGEVVDLVTVPPRADSPLPLPFGQLSWSPASGLVAFTSALSGNADVWVATTDGTGRVSPLIRDPAPKSSPAWSPDGGRLAFSCRGKSGQGTDICTVDAKGNDVRRLDTGPGDEDAPAWSPDGQWIAYGSRPVCDEPIACLRSSVAIIAAGGGNPRFITDGLEDDRYPAWSRDGLTLAFMRNSEIWLMAPDGLRQTRLAAGLWPTWRP